MIFMFYPVHKLAILAHSAQAFPVLSGIVSPTMQHYGTKTNTYYFSMFNLLLNQFQTNTGFEK